MPQRIALSKTVVASLPVPSKGRVYVYDAKVPSLAVCVTSNGTRTFYRCGKVRGRPTRIRIAATTEITVEQARVIAADISLQVASGQNPRAERSAGKTIGELWNWYLENHAKPRKRSWERDVRRWESHLIAWKNRSANAVTREDVVVMHNSIRQSAGPSAANRVIFLLRHMYSLGLRNGWVKSNPASQIDAYPMLARERFLTPDELPRFIAAVESLRSQDARDAFMLMLWTGARRGNILSMRWAELNLEAAIWVVPSTKSKNARPMAVVLSEPAIEILKRRQVSASSEWVFPTQSETGHYRWPRDAWTRVIAASGLANLRIHDIRRTFGSWQAASGASLQVIGKSLGHTNIASTAIYARLNLDPVRRSVDAAVSAMQAAIQKTPEKK